MGDPRPLAVLTTSYPADSRDGAGTFVRGFCRACVRAGLPVEVLCPELPFGPGDPGDDGITVRRLAYARPRRLQGLSTLPGAPDWLAASGWRWGAAGAFAARLTATLARRHRRYRGLVSHWLLPSTLSGVIAGGSRCHVGIAHGTDLWLLERLPGRRAVAQTLAARTTRLVFVSEALRSRFARVAGGPVARCRVQPMGVEPLPRVSRQTARARWHLTGTVWLWMGRFVPVKAPQRALEQLDTEPEATLVFAGAGPLEPELRARAERFGDRVRFAGWVSGEAKAQLFAAADALLSTSTTLADGRGEGAPVVLQEAHAYGLPVLGDPIGVDPATPRTWDAALSRMLGGVFLP